VTIITTDAESEAAFERAELHDNDPRAQTVEYVPDLKLLIVGLSNGRRLVLPIEDMLGLGEATAKQLQNYELLGHGTGISFPDLNVDLYVPALIEGAYGNRRWMAELGSKGGRAKTAAKRQASRANGAKGGRPRKVLADSPVTVSTLQPDGNNKTVKHHMLPRQDTQISSADFQRWSKHHSKRETHMAVTDSQTLQRLRREEGFAEQQAGIQHRADTQESSTV
jgi:hypothetical protein